LDPACEEITQYTDIAVDYVPTKIDVHMAKHRSYCRIIFSIRKKEEREIVKVQKKIDTIYKDIDADYARKLYKKQNAGIAQYEKDQEKAVLQVTNPTFKECARPLDDILINDDVSNNTSLEEIAAPVITEEIVSENTSVAVVDTVPAENQNEYVEDDNGDLRSVSDICSLHSHTVSEIHNKIAELTDTQIASYIMEAERHIGPQVNQAYTESWIRDYLTHYIDLLARSQTVTKTTLDYRLWHNYVQDYNNYANILNRKYTVSGRDDISNTLNKYKKNSTYIDGAETYYSQYSNEQLEDMLVNNHLKKEG
jgi:hypothetical protein